MQQVFLYLAARNQVPDTVLETNARGGSLMRHYWVLLKFLRGDTLIRLDERSIMLTEAHTALGIPEFKYLSAINRISPAFLTRVNLISPSLAKELWAVFGSKSGGKAKHSCIAARH